MSNWRALKTTGTNDIPLGNKRRFGAAPIEDSAPPQLAALSPSDFPRSRFQDSDPRDRKSSEERQSSIPGMCLLSTFR
jgi:splicing factor 1